VHQTPLIKDVFLIGGGHSHVLFIRQWAMQPIAGVRLTLISTSVSSPYSGMLPGLIAGHYTSDDIHIDLLKLCAWANVRFIEATMSALELESKQVMFEHRPPMSFDVLSLDTGSTPDLSVPGAAQHVTPVKPVSNFYTRWQDLLQRINSSNAIHTRIGVVGSGAGGFELITAMRHALPDDKADCYWFLRDEHALRGRPAVVGRLAIKAAKACGVQVVTQFDVMRVDTGVLHASDGRTHELDEILWCTGAQGPNWPQAAGLSVDERGFVATNRHLQSISHPFVFATGDIGTQVDTPSAKAGVFAVRQAPVLHTNIRKILLAETLDTYKPQSDFLSLMATGGKRAIASRGPFAIEADWVWRWKDYIDQSFMRRFSTLPLRVMNESLARLPNALKTPESDSNGLALQRDYTPNQQQCRGCGAKVGQDILKRVIDKTRSINSTQNRLDQRYVQLSAAGDTAVLQLDTGLLAQSVDQINAIVDDPYLFARIATLHALSDVQTLDTSPHSVQAMIGLPRATERIVERDLTQLMQGMLEVLEAEDSVLLGGHTVQGAEMSLGLVVNATVADAAANAVPIVQPGDALVLTQAIGNGTLFAGLMQGIARGRKVMDALPDMLTSNAPAASILRQYGSRFMTDVTGFGVLGHLQQLLTNDNVGAELWLDSVPLLDGVYSLASKGCRSSLWPQNSRILARIDVADSIDATRLSLLCDPQTSGGMLAIVPDSDASACVQALRDVQYKNAAVIGQITASQKARLFVS